MRVLSYEGKTENEVLEKALKELKLTAEDVMYKVEEQKGKLFKTASIKLDLIPLAEIVEFTEDYLKQLLNDMGIETTFEVKIREKQIYIKMYSNNNPVLIGKNGQTLEALQNIIKNVISKSIGIYPIIILDVEDYKAKQERRIERLAKDTAREVLKTKIEARLDNMNSYERRIVHNILTDYKGIYTLSEGEEPNRCVVIKIKEDK